VTVPAEVATYLDELVERLRAVVEVEAAYALGSVAYGAYERGRSDVDVVVVVPRPLSLDQKRALVGAAESIPPVGRKLELVVYARDSDAYEVNLNTGELVSFDPEEEPNGFWFVLDRAIGAEHALRIVGPPWDEVFEPVSRAEIAAALRASLDYHEREEPLTANSLLNACRSWRWAETGEWVSKPEAAQWLRQRVRDALGEAA
jgi:predicted nucleotidyltransferase